MRKHLVILALNVALISSARAAPLTSKNQFQKENIMKQLLFVTTATLLVVGNSIAADVQYNMRVDGITCSFCVTTSTKALKKIEGVKGVGSDLEKGVIKVCADEKTIFTDEQLTKLFTEKGFAYRSMEKQKKCEKL